MTVFLQVVELTLLILLGYLASGRGWFTSSGIQTLDFIVARFSLPALIIAKLQTDPAPGLWTGQLQCFVLGGLFMLFSGALSWYVFRRESAPRRAGLTSMCMFSNAAFMGFPILSAGYGDQSLLYGIMYVAIFNILNWSIGVAIYGREYVSPRKLITTPALIAAILGTVMYVAQIRLPHFLLDTLNMLSLTTTPLAMLVIGSRLVGIRISDLTDRRILLACLLRLLILPALMWLMCTVLRTDSIVRAVLTVVTAMPSAAVTAIQAATYHGDAPFISRAVALCSVLSIFSIPLVMTII